jgi:hypothetical protein
MTENLLPSQSEIPFKSPTQVVQVIEQIEEKNLNLIQNTNQAEAHYDFVFKEHQALEIRLESIFKLNHEKIQR